MARWRMRARAWLVRRRAVMVEGLHLWQEAHYWLAVGSWGEPGVLELIARISKRGLPLLPEILGVKWLRSRSASRGLTGHHARTPRVCPHLLVRRAPNHGNSKALPKV